MYSFDTFSMNHNPTKGDMPIETHLHTGMTSSSSDSDWFEGKTVLFFS